MRMPMNVAVGQFGSRVQKTDSETWQKFWPQTRPQSDEDWYKIQYSGPSSFVELNTSRKSSPKNSHKTSEKFDCETIELLSFFRQCFLPSPTFHAKLSTLTRTQSCLDVTLLKRITERHFLLEVVPI